ncbi:ATPase [archaeon]|nr:ATPase [archaeon]
MVKKKVKHAKHKIVHRAKHKSKTHKTAHKKHKIVLPERVIKNTRRIKEAGKILERVRTETHKSVVGQDATISAILRSILANGHSIVEGVPGIAKTLIVKTLAQTTGCTFSRVQFTADLLPTDITGLTTYNQETNQFSVVKGPVFANFIIADEINRSPPKVQSALLEAMQEEQVTIGRTTYKLPLPFFVMATQNPVEQAGVYSLPEAQLDRFLFKIFIGYPTVDDEHEILQKNMTLQKFNEFNVKQITNQKILSDLQQLTKEIYLSPDVKKYIISIMDATRNPSKYDISMGKYIEFGASPRGSIGLFIASKAEALIKGSAYVTPHHVKLVTHDVLRHRILLNYEGQAENISTDKIIDEILSKVAIP